jgi:uncharacterized protein (DUF885 family)
LIWPGFSWAIVAPSKEIAPVKQRLFALLLASIVPAILAAPVSAQSTTQPDAAAQLKALFADSDEASIKRKPIFALFRGDLRYADRFGDFVSDEYFAAELKAAADELLRLARIDRNALNATDRIAYDVFKYQQEEAVRTNSAPILPLTRGRPFNHFSGYHTFYPSYSSGDGGVPFVTLADYENGLKRHRDFALHLDRSIGQFRRGKAEGIVETKLTVRIMIDQFDTQAKQPVEEAPFFGPVKKFPDGILQADRDRLTLAYRATIENDIYPAFRRMRDFLANEYLPAAREGVGLKFMKGGDLAYRELVANSTTTDMTPEAIHQLGLSEVKRILVDMERVKTEVSFQGTLPEFFDHLRTDPKYKMSSRQAMTDRYYAIGKTVDALIDRYFSARPKLARLEIRPYEEFREKYEAAASVQPGTPDGKRPNIFYFNAYDLPSRTTPGMTTLYLHEGVPGHHFQGSLARENDAIPNFLRFGGNGAFNEGWALYAESLGYEMGLYKDPIQRFGTLSDEMLRAMRLVVDTGIHAKGWGREQAIDYMLANSNLGRTDVTAEVERYIAIPGQALAYKIGALTIQRLRKKGENALGTRFDIRAFHEQVLGTGALPMSVLEKKIDDWIVAQR